MKDLSVNDSIPFHFSKCLNKHLFADTRHKALEFAYVSVEGPITEIEPVDLERDARPMAHRYLGIDVGDAYIADMRQRLWITSPVGD